MKEMREMQVRRKGLTIMWQLIGLVIPLLPVMLIAIILGVLGYLCAIFLTIIAGYGLVQGRLFIIDNHVFVMLVTLAVMRGVLHYGEQYCNHFIAFKLLALIRHKVFTTLRKLCPARLDGKDKGNLISIITSDIELLEVFYAHTISPIVIAVITSLTMVLFIGHYSPWAALLASAAYLTVGAVIPLIHGRKGSAAGMEFRTSFGDLNSFLLDSLRGVEETIQYNNGKERLEQIQERSNELARLQKRLNILEASQRSVTNMVILVFSFGMLFLMTWMHLSGAIDFKALLVTTIAMMGSFGPVVALSNLSNNLNQTLASGERVLSLLEEMPLVEEVTGEEEIDFTGAEVKNVNFSYEDEQILEDYSISIPERTIIGIHGQSGSGKSTLLKLLMRFWDVKSGQIDISGKNVRHLNTTNLRNMESYVTQETYLFHDSIANNIAIGKPRASREEIIQAAKKASIHELICTLPKGYDTNVGELGDTLSGGEKQRIGIARAFLYDAPLILLDEPTSNLDSLNEGIILKSLEESCDKKTVVLVSHRKSTMSLAEVVYEMNQGRIS